MYAHISNYYVNIISHLSLHHVSKYVVCVFHSYMHNIITTFELLFIIPYGCVEFITNNMLICLYIFCLYTLYVFYDLFLRKAHSAINCS